MEIEALRSSALFRGLTPAEAEIALRALNTSERAYPKDALIFVAGDVADRMGLVLSGSVTIEANDLWGGRTILSHVGPGQFFAETYALLGEAMLVDVRANEDCRVGFFRLDALQNSEAWAAKLTRSLLSISAHKNLALSLRSLHISPKSVRERVMAYLGTVSLQTRSREFDIPFDRRQLADYLDLDRTALSKELSKMRDDGLIEFRKNHFILK